MPKTSAFATGILAPVPPRDDCFILKHHDYQGLHKYSLISSTSCLDPFLYKLPPLGPDLTPFRDSDSAFNFINIAGFPDKRYMYHTLKKKSSPL